MGQRTLFLILFLPAVVFFFVAQLPLAVALNIAGVGNSSLRWSAVNGTIWNGNLQDVYYAQYEIGNIDLKANPLALLTLRYGGVITINGPYLQVTSKVVAGAAGSLTLADGAARLFLEGYDIRDAFNSPMRGQAEIKIDRLVMTKHGCTKAAFSVTTDALESMAQNYGGAGFPLSGTAVCENRSLVLALAGREGAETLAITTRLKPNLDYISDFVVETAERDLALGLRAYGFQSRGNQLILTQTGNFVTNP